MLLNLLMPQEAPSDYTLESSDDDKAVKGGDDTAHAFHGSVVSNKDTDVIGPGSGTWVSGPVPMAAPERDANGTV